MAYKYGEIKFSSNFLMGLEILFMGQNDMSFKQYILLTFNY